MIDVFESTARAHPRKVFLTFVDASGKEVAYTYRQARLLASAMARRLRGKGVRRGDYVSVDLPNCAEYVLLALAAAYGSFTLVCLNNRLTDTEKLTRLLELEREGLRVVCRIDRPRMARFMAIAQAELRGDDRRGARTIMGAEADAINDAVHFAEREAHLFDAKQNALVMFTSGTTGKAKAVPLTWQQLTESARASNRALSEQARGLWQGVLPLYHIGGFQVLVRSVLNWTPLRLYARFDAARVLEDAVVHEVTHISVVDKMLQDLLAADAGRVDARHPDARRAEAPSASPSASDASALSRYRCILLGGGPLNARTVGDALKVRARVYASYGMTETASQIANTLITPSFSGGLKLLPGYTARIVDPDEQGFGRLAVRGPSVFEGYLNARAAFTVDGYFLTGDTAALYDGAIFIRERTADMFVSGGENVYPAEIAAALRQVPGVADAYVFGVPDSTWGRRPVAVVERGEQTQSGGAQVANAQLTPQSLREALAPRLSKVYMPQQFCVVDELPRLGIGKVDRAAVEAQYEQRLQVERIVLYHVRLPFKNPFRTARGTLHDRDSLIVEVIDHAGRRGLGECVAFPTDWYLPETLGQDVRVIRGLLAPLLLETAFLHPREVSRLFGESPEALVHPMACAALEMALWDLYGQVVRKPLWKLLDEEYRRLGGKALAGATAATAGATGTAGAAAMGSPSSTGGLGGRLRVSAGAVVGIGSPNQTVEAVRGCVEAGYRRVKLKISPVQGLECVRAVREAFPKLVITLDANQSFPPHRVEDLRAYDDLGVSWIEEPFDLSGRDGGRVSAKKAFLRLSSLQRMLKTPICVDESFVDAAGAYEMLLFPELRCVALKLGKMGGIQPALEYLCKAQEMDCAVWMGGMYDTGISKRAHAAFQTLPGIDVPGDIGATARYFNVDVTRPVYGVERGCVALNERGHEFGLGCSLDVQALAKVLVNRLVIDRP